MPRISRATGAPGSCCTRPAGARSGSRNRSRHASPNITQPSRARTTNPSSTAHGQRRRRPSRAGSRRRRAVAAPHRKQMSALSAISVPQVSQRIGERESCLAAPVAAPPTLLGVRAAPWRRPLARQSPPAALLRARPTRPATAPFPGADSWPGERRLRLRSPLNQPSRSLHRPAAQTPSAQAPRGAIPDGGSAGRPAPAR